MNRIPLGQTLSLLVSCTDNDRIVRHPEAAPYADVYAATTLVETARLGVLEKNQQTGVFGTALFLGDKYNTGRHMVVLRYTVSAVQYQQFVYFEVIAGGTPIMAMREYRKPEAHYLVQHLRNRQLVFGRNPQV